MPIRKVYGPSASVAGLVSQQAGLGDFRQRQDQYNTSREQFDQQLAFREEQFAQQQALRQQQVNQQQGQFDRQLDFRAQQSAFQNRLQAGQLQHRISQDRRAFRAQQQQANDQRQDQFLMEELRQQGSLERGQQQFDQRQFLLDGERGYQEEQLEARQLLNQEERERAWKRESLDNLEKQAESLISQYSRLDLNEKGQKELIKHKKKLLNLHGYRDRLRPVNYAEEIELLVVDMQLAGIEGEDFQVPPNPDPTLQEQMGLSDSDVQGYKDKGYRSGPGYQQVDDYSAFAMDIKNGNPQVRHIKLRDRVAESQQDYTHEKNRQDALESEYNEAYEKVRSRMLSGLKDDEGEPKVTAYMVRAEMESRRNVMAEVASGNDFHPPGMPGGSLGPLWQSAARAYRSGQFAYPSSKQEVQALPSGTFFVQNGVTYQWSLGQVLKVE